MEYYFIRPGGVDRRKKKVFFPYILKENSKSKMIDEFILYSIYFLLIHIATIDFYICSAREHLGDFFEFNKL